MKKLNRKAQSTLEYAILIACVVGALLAMQIYLKRAYEGKVSSSVDQVGNQFDSLHTTSTSISARTGTVVQTVNNAVKNTVTDMTESRSASEAVDSLNVMSN